MQRRSFPAIPVLAVACALSLGLMAWALASTSGAAQSSFTPPPFDEAAQSGTPTVPEDLGWQEVDAQAYVASVCGVFRVEDGRAAVWLTNPESNDVWLKLRVMDAEGNVLGETGLVRPGEYVEYVSVDPAPESGEQVVMKLMAYEPETYRSAGAVSLSTTAQSGS